ncbi:MAG: universal stress protein [Gammaproteobacteria bacterium]|nr:universal stress protein [Gammaproteobacteria bacterium]NIR82955.1 universal stress protein [Gammaproteobacteria bacterium]NIR90320.1 universal stress protein [Gammaproteobacteria bacterium]NIU04101.1 universal stress protein [Gammaproteobacteria bacterium]NIV51397.1 universal stress protein [Gammaproteobacteria bacterium]
MAAKKSKRADESKFDTILVAVDGSGHAVKAIRLAIELAKRFDSRLLMLSVYKHYSSLESAHSLARAGKLPEPPDVTLRAIGRDAVESAKERAKEAGLKKIEGTVKRGPPARTIVKFAKDKNVDVIIMGSRGLGDIEGFFLGSVSHKVSALAECTCIVVK